LVGRPGRRARGPGAGRPRGAYLRPGAVGDRAGHPVHLPDRVQRAVEDPFGDAAGGAGSGAAQRAAGLAGLVRGAPGLAADRPSGGRERVIVRWLRPAVLVAAVLAEALVLWFGLRHEWFHSILQTESVAVGLFAVAALATVGLTGRRVLLLVLAGGVLLQLAALGAGPSSSDDVNRYVWD